MDSGYNFNISLSVLNHLGRNLYRNFITILGEAISNSWDADAEHVWINISSDKSEFIIRDDGTGMTSDDFQNKFLKIGYSKRKMGCNHSTRNRPFIGRKGIGKLALLSCSAEVVIITKASSEEEWVGGIINNSELDDAIENDVDQSVYHLQKLSEEFVDNYCNDLDHGTVLVFRNVNDDVPIGDISNIRKLIALHFRFSLIDKGFDIYVNDEIIETKDLHGLIEKTQFLWVINGGVERDEFMQKLKENVSEIVNIKVGDELIKGFIASTEKPRDLAILGSGERVSIDLFVNGRMRERDISRHTPKSRIPENYLYGQIHYDKLDSNDGVDRFTSSREGVIANDSLFSTFMKEFDKLLRRIVDEWDELRLESNNDGDPDNKRKNGKFRASRSLLREVASEYKNMTSDNVQIIDDLQKRIAKDAEFNFSSYAECFISENLVRELIRKENIALDQKAIKEVKRWRDVEADDKRRGGISIVIRDNDEDLYYLSMETLCRIASTGSDGYPDKLTNHNLNMEPIRDAVMHTSRLTKEAKAMLTTVFYNIRAKVGQLLSGEDT